MISSLGTQWSTSDLTGNGQFVDTGTAIYVVSNSAPTSHILKSTDEGLTFVSVAEIELEEGSFQFDPSVSYEGGILHIVGSEANNADPSRFDLVYRSFDTTTDTLSSPTKLVISNEIHSGYDIETVDGKSYVVAGILNSNTPLVNGYSLYSFTIEGGVATPILVQSEGYNRNGEVFGGISLASTTTDIELFYTAHTRKVTLGAIGQQIRYRTLDIATDTWSSATILHEFVSHYIDDKLTVLEVGDDRVVANSHYVQTKSRFSTTLLLGSRVAGVWTWVYYPAKHPQFCPTEPTLLCDESGNVRLAYLLGDVNTNANGSLAVADVNLSDLKLTPRIGNFIRLQFRWLRGSSYPIKDTAKWAVIGERKVTSGVTPSYVSELNTPPVAAIVPATATLQREQLLLLDASSTQDNDFDTLQFTWSTTSPVELRPIEGAPSKINVWAPKTLGPDPLEVTVKVSVQDLGIDGQPINPPVETTATLSIPENLAPTISWGDHQTVDAPRNSAIVIFPTVTDPESDSLVYEWRHVSGPELILFRPTPSEVSGVVSVDPFLTVLTHGVSTQGAASVYELTVSDQINPSVASQVTIDIAPISSFNVDTRTVHRAYFSTLGDPSAIRNRNNPSGGSGWSEFESLGFACDVLRTRQNTNLETGKSQSIYISPRSVVLFAPQDTTPFKRRIYLPGNSSGDIVDAHLTQSGDVLVLDDSNDILLYSNNNYGVDNISDFWQASISLTPYLRNATIKFFEITRSINNKRVLAFVTNKGLLLLQIEADTFTPEATLFLSVFDLNLYGGDDVVFVRFQEVESLKKGKILIGSKHPITPNFSAIRFEYFETLYDLTIRAVVQTWDRTNRINDTVQTGEILQVSGADYFGKLQAPDLDLDNVDTTSLRLKWQQIRSDLVENYNIYWEVTPGVPGTFISQRHQSEVDTISLPPVIISQPQPLNILHTTQPVLKVVAAGELPLSYQWFENGSSLLGQTFDTLYPTIASKGSNFHVIVTDGAVRSVTSQVAPYIVKPWFETQPSEQTVTAGETATFASVTNGTGPLYHQWFRAGQAIDGATNPSYTTPTTTTDDNGSVFSVRVSDSYGNQLFSESVTLTVLP